MSNVKIVADSTCDLSQDMLNEYDITMIPLMISMGEITKRILLKSSLMNYTNGRTKQDRLQRQPHRQ